MLLRSYLDLREDPCQAGLDFGALGLWTGLPLVMTSWANLKQGVGFRWERRDMKKQTATPKPATVLIHGVNKDPMLK